MSKVALVTGGARRLGAAVVRHLHSSGWRLIVHYHQSAASAGDLELELNSIRKGSVKALCADLDNFKSYSTLIDEAVAVFGRLDALVNNASVFYPTPMGKITIDDWTALAGTNLIAPLFLAQEIRQHLNLTKGAIVNIVDIHSDRPLHNYSIYCALKGGLATLTKALAIEMAPTIRVNGVSPGAILWPADGQISEVQKNEIVRHALLKRAGEPLDVAKTVGFLLNDAPYITGQIIGVDGGRSIAL